MTYHIDPAIILDALAHPTRRAIIDCLRGGPLAVGRIADGLPVSRPAVSQHLKILHDAGLVRPNAVGARRIYALEQQGVGALRDYLDDVWGEALSAFAAHVRQKERKE